MGLAQDSRRIEVFRRDAHGRWEFEEATDGQSIRLTSIDAEIVVDEIYANPLGTAGRLPGDEPGTDP